MSLTTILNAENYFMIHQYKYSFEYKICHIFRIYGRVLNKTREKNPSDLEMSNIISIQVSHEGIKL
jgi:hypothetical protein